MTGRQGSTKDSRWSEQHTDSSKIMCDFQYKWGLCLVCMYVCPCICIYVCTCLWSQRVTFRSCNSSATHLVFWSRIASDLGDHHRIGLIGKSPGNLLVSASPGDYKCAPLGLAFTWALGTSSHLHTCMARASLVYFWFSFVIVIACWSVAGIMGVPHPSKLQQW